MTSRPILERLARPRVALAALAVGVVALAALYARFALLASFNHDEVEHVHVGFKLAQGLLPYRDFYQNHLPAWWLVSVASVRAFPFSIDAILAGRAVSTLSLVGCWLLGFRVLARAPGGRSWLARLVYTWAVIGLAYRFELPLARPDPLMTLFGTAAICGIPARSPVSRARATLLGLLAGLAVSVSPKIGPMVLVVPAVMAAHALRERRLAPALALPFYGVGAVLALLPTLFWLLHHDLLAAFRFDVLDLNRALSKPWLESFGFLHAPTALPGALGALAWLALDRRPSPRSTHGAWLLAIWFAAGIGLGLMARHVAPYNMQMMTVPIAVGVATLAAVLWMRTRGVAFRMLLLAALLAYPTLHLASSLARLKDYWGISQPQLERLVELARPGGRTCAASSPWHPIFCHDVAGLSNDWDVLFPQRVDDPEQIARFRRLWSEGLRRTVEERPDLIVRRGADDHWAEAVEAGMLTEAELARLDALEPAYDVIRMDDGEVWVRRGE